MVKTKFLVPKMNSYENLFIASHFLLLIDITMTRTMSMTRTMTRVLWVVWRGVFSLVYHTKICGCQEML